MLSQAVIVQVYVVATVVPHPVIAYILTFMSVFDVILSENDIRLSDKYEQNTVFWVNQKANVAITVPAVIVEPLTVFTFIHDGFVPTQKQ